MHVHQLPWLLACSGPCSAGPSSDGCQTQKQHCLVRSSLAHIIHVAPEQRSAPACPGQTTKIKLLALHPHNTTFLDRKGLMAVDRLAGLAERNARNKAMKDLPWQAIAIMLQRHDANSNKLHTASLSPSDTLSVSGRQGSPAEPAMSALWSRAAAVLEYLS